MSSAETLTPAEIDFVREAEVFLENPGVLMRAAHLAGQPIEHGLRLLPARVRERIHEAVRRSMDKGLQVVTQTVPRREFDFSDARLAAKKTGLLHSVAAFGAGAVGGFFGAVSLPVELPVTTAIMLRSISQIASEFGHDIRTREVQLECLYVLSLGSSSRETLNSTYWTSRVAFMDLIRVAAREMESGLIAKLLAQIGSRFELIVGEKALAEVMPVVGAIGGGAINAAFSEHFNKAARFHFGLRALEKKYGEDAVRSAFVNSRT